MFASVLFYLMIHISFTIWKLSDSVVLSGFLPEVVKVKLFHHMPSDINETYWTTAGFSIFLLDIPDCPLLLVRKLNLIAIIVQAKSH